MCLGTDVSGYNHVWAQMCLGTIVSGHKRVWAQSCGPSRVGPIMYGHNRGGTVEIIIIIFFKFLSLWLNHSAFNISILEWANAIFFLLKYFLVLKEWLKSDKKNLAMWQSSILTSCSYCILVMYRIFAFASANIRILFDIRIRECEANISCECEYLKYF